MPSRQRRRPRRRSRLATGGPHRWSSLRRKRTTTRKRDSQLPGKSVGMTHTAFDVQDFMRPELFDAESRRLRPFNGHRQRDGSPFSMWEKKKQKKWRRPQVRGGSRHGRPGAATTDTGFCDLRMVVVPSRAQDNDLAPRVTSSAPRKGARNVHSGPHVVPSSPLTGRSSRHTGGTAAGED